VTCSRNSLTLEDGGRWGTLTPFLGEYTCFTPYVYSRCMSRVRTNIEIEDTYLETIMDRYGVRTKTEAVDLALRHLAGQPMSREDALAMRGAHAIGKIPVDGKPPSS
jgi:Arc/MetJ family transcription regulator